MSQSLDTLNKNVAKAPRHPHVRKGAADGATPVINGQ
jgi:hypothetical protein